MAIYDQDKNLGILIGRARKVLRHEFESRVCANELTVPQVHVLAALWDGDGKTISQLSNIVCSDGPTLTSLLDRMEGKDLIHRERDTCDRRVVRIWLKERGRSLEPAVLQASDEVIGLARRGMTEAQFEHLCQLLLLLCQTLENGEEAEPNGD